MNYLDAKARRSIEPLKDEIVAYFSVGDWQALGIDTDCLALIENHPRLLRSKQWGDPDYPDCVFAILIEIAKRDLDNLGFVRRRLDKVRAAHGTNISSAPAAGQPSIVFTPSVFSVPEAAANEDLVSVMMPFDAGLNAVYTAVRAAAESNKLSCKRGDDIWNSSVVVQDIFDLIYRSRIVVCDFSGRNPNVFYEAGIAHTLGKQVIPITQSVDDVPFNLRHHRFIKYLNNSEGCSELTTRLDERIGYLIESRRKLSTW